MTEQPPTTRTKLTPEQQSAVLYWPLEAKIPIIPCDSKIKTFGLAKWRDVDFSKIDFTANLAAGVYDNGNAIVLGKTLPGCPHPYSFALDFDGVDAVEKFFGSWDNVLKLSDTHKIEWHGNNRRLHIVFFCKKTLPKRGSL